MPKLIDLTGKTFDRIKILERDYETQQLKNTKEVFWKCQCECGTIFSARGHDIRDGKIKSCGCLRRENARKINYQDLTSKTFGKLKVLKENKEKRIADRCIWVCQCDCGNIVEISSKGLLTGTSSCGCLKSKGELQIIQLLQMLKIQYITQYAPENCKNQLQLKFDFYLPELNTIIEYNGAQHYEAINFLGGEKRFETQQKCDNIKKQWCIDNNVKLVEIPYTDYKLLTTQYLKEKLNI